MKPANWGSIFAKVIAAALLFAGLSRHGYDYYTLLRWFVCAISAFTTFRAVKIGKGGWGWSFAIVALLFNPLVPVHFKRETWAIVDVGVALLLLISVVPIDWQDRARLG